MKLLDEVAVITGGSIGIGAAIARLFAREGAKVAILDVDAEHGMQTCRQVQEEGYLCEFYQADVSKADQVACAAEQILRELKTISILVNNAGIWMPGTVTTLEEETWDRIIHTNLKGIFLVSKYILPVMVRANKGVVINIASVAGLVGARDCSAYAASKGGIINLSRSMALDYAPHNIRVNCLCPGLTDTAQGDSVVSHYKPQDNPAEAKRNWQPFSYVGSPKDMAQAALFMASNDSAFMTGSVMVVDGGLTAE